jgi:hypothetical protein
VDCISSVEAACDKVKVSRFTSSIIPRNLVLNLKLAARGLYLERRRHLRLRLGTAIEQVDRDLDYGLLTQEPDDAEMALGRWVVCQKRRGHIHSCSSMYS